MAYVTLADIEGRIPLAYLTQALDDDGDGTIDAWDAVAAQAIGEVDSFIGLRFSLPLGTPLPAIVQQSAQAFACEAIYRRRGISNEQNPFFTVAENFRKTLRDIAQGKTPLKPGVDRAQPSGGAVIEAAPTFSKTGARMA